MERCKGKLMRHSLCLAVVFTLAACAANVTTTLKNSSGDTRYCYLVHDSTLARIPAVGEYNKCLNDAGAAGYKKVEE